MKISRIRSAEEVMWIKIDRSNSTLPIFNLSHGRAGHRGGVLDPQRVHGDETSQGESSESDK